MTPADCLAPRARGRGIFVWFAAAVAGVMSFEYLAFGPASTMYNYGGARDAIPAFLAMDKADTVFRLWAPFIAGGLDRLSVWGLSDPFNVETLLFALFPAWFANGVHFFAQRFLLVCFTALVCREQLGMSRRRSLVAGALHASVSYFNLGDLLALPAVPLVIWLLPRLERGGAPFVLAAAAGLIYSTLSVFAQNVLYIMPFLVLWFIVGLRRPWGRFYAVLGTFCAVWATAESHQLLALLANAPLAYRIDFVRGEIGLSLSGLFYFSPYPDVFNYDPWLRWFIQTAPLASIMIGLIAGWLSGQRGTAEYRLFLRCVGLYAFLSVKVLFVAIQWTVVSVLPWIGGLNMARFWAVPSSFLITVIMAMSLLVILPRALDGRAARWCLAGTATLVVGLLLYQKASLFYPLFVDDWGQRHFEVRALDALERRPDEPFRVASVLPLGPMYAVGQGLETVDGVANVYPRVYRDLWLRVLDPLFRALPATREIVDPPNGKAQDVYIFLGFSLVDPGIGLLPGETPEDGLAHGFDVDRRFNMALLSLLNVRYLLSEYPLRGRRLGLVHAPASPPLVQSRDYANGRLNHPRPGWSIWEKIVRAPQEARKALRRKRHGKDVYVYENLDVLPRYRFVERVNVLSADTAVLDALGSASVAGLATTAWIREEGGLAAGEPRRFSGGAVRLVREAPGDVRLDVENVADGFLVFSVTWSSFWHAEVDGRTVRPVRTNHAQIGIPVPAGSRLVRLSYRPPYARWAVLAGPSGR